MIKKILASAATLLIILGVVVLAIGNNMLETAVHPDNIYRTDYDSSAMRIYKKYPELRPWRDSLLLSGELRDTFILNNDGLRLHGVIYQHKDTLPHRSVLMIPGYCDNVIIMLRYAYCLFESLDCNVVMVERQYVGQSEGDHITFGWRDRLDMPLWLSCIHSLWPDRDIAVHGLSMGAATTMMLSGDEIADSLRVKCFIEDCGYSSTREQLAHNLNTLYPYLPEHPILDVASMLARMKYGWTFEESSAIDQVAKCQLPMLFIHGEEDSFVPTWMVHKVYAAKPEPKELWITQGCEHAKSIHKYYPEYVSRLDSFMNKYME